MEWAEMKWMRSVLSWCSVLLLVCAVLVGVFFQETRVFFDAFANHASVLGLVVSVVGFVLTVWTVLETLRVSTAAQEVIKKEVNAVRRETMGMLSKISLYSMGNTFEPAFLFATPYT